MIKTKAEYEHIALQIMDLIIRGQRPTPELIPDCSPKDFQDILEQCVLEDLVRGYDIYRSVDGTLHYESPAPPYITYKGFIYIDSIKQTQAIDIAKTAQLQAEHAIEGLAISREQLNLQREQTKSIASLAYDARDQANTARKELAIMQEKLRFAKAEADGAKKDAQHAKAVAWIAIVISICDLIFPYIFE